MSEIAVITYRGAAPGANANTYSLFDTTVVFPHAARGLAASGVKRLVLDMKFEGGGGVLNRYKSSDRGVTWTQIGTEAVAAPAGTASVVRDFLVAIYDDFKLEWVNGGSAQTTWNISMGLSEDMASSV